MNIYTTPDFHLIFGTAQDNFFPAEVLPAIPYPLDITKLPYALLAQQIAEQKTSLNSVVLLKQTHGTQGYSVTLDNLNSLTTVPRHEGDFLCTSLPGVGLGVLTADCLPMALYDPVQHVIAIVHAGWRGTVNRIGQKAVKMLATEYGTKAQDMQVFMGLCAHPCCYQVSEDFKLTIPFSWVDNVFESRQTGLFFNLPLCNALLLQEVGVRPSMISTEHSSCTICDTSMCSYRRDGAASCRQLSCIVLRER